MSVSYEPTLRLEMLDFVPKNATSILEIGCGRSQFANEIKKRQACTITAIEPDSVMANEAMANHDKVIEQPVEEALSNLEEQYDCILMIDVLEHLVNPWVILEQLRDKLTENGCVVVSIPNMRYFHALKGLMLHRDWEYDKSGVKDITHLRFFTENSIKNMFLSRGYQLSKITGINKIRLPMKWLMLSRLFPGILGDVCYPQFACVAHKKPT
jgi:2-polyprenyl-3-methyl-5-hydroxy-6-metoxy-1,4-benzoquinol methylase